MKRFRTITAICLSVILVMVVGNVFYLHGLYGSIKEQTMQTVAECVRRAYILEIIDRIKRGARDGADDSFLRLTLIVEGERQTDGGYEYPALLENLENTMSAYFGVIARSDSTLGATDMARLDAIFRKELAASGINPAKAAIIPYGNGEAAASGEWSVDFEVGDEPLYTARFSSLSGHVLGQMGGIMATSAAILLLTGFMIWYLLRQVGRLRSIEQMKDDFTHNMTHELKTPVAVAYSAADSMLRYYDQSDEARNRRFLKIIIQRLGFLSGMIENILSMSMERFRTMKLDMENVRLAQLVAEVAGMIELKADKPVRVSVDIPDDAEVCADQLHLGNIVSNILDNAVKYSGENVEIAIKGDDRSLRISDNGIGIAKVDLPHIFDKFYRVTCGDKYEVGGYGLGLFYVRQVVTLMGWRIDVASTPGKGTTFVISFYDDEKG